ncbi:hypothetical protein SFRURICE_016961 [Spodoptera frugiperda]|nr:hypothetical protein SFRURICE_016961 [Spodoptera frugiperda]
MEMVVETQYQIMQAMNTLLTNFKKDGPSRRTTANVQKKIDLLDKYWAEFQNNHEKIRERENLTHPYFAQDSYEQTKEFYNSTREYLCRVCNSDHNTLLHDAYGKGNGQTSNHRPTHQNTVNDNKNKMPGNSSNHVYQEDLSETLLTTALIKVKAYDGKLIVLRALLDQGSQTSLITERAAQLLKLPRSRCKEKSKDKQDFQSRKPRSKRLGIRSHLITTLIALFFFITTVFSQEQSTVPYSLTEINKALYFDKMSNMQFIRDEWKLIVYYDMDPYWEGSTTFKKYLEQINNVCEKASNKAICDIILLQLNHSYDELQYYDTMLLSQHFKDSMRKRRGLIDDQRFADKYEKDISLIKENEKTLARLWKNQTSVVEAEYNLLKRTESAINRQHKVIHQHLNNLTQATNTLSKNVQEQEVMNELALSTIIATNMLSKLKSIQDTLIESITEFTMACSAHMYSRQDNCVTNLALSRDNYQENFLYQ